MRHIVAVLARTLALPLLLGIAGGARPLAAQGAPPPRAAADSAEDLINADRPGIADGSRVIAPGQVQLEIGAQRERHVDAATHSTLSFVPTLLRIGVLSWLEARFESNSFAHERATDETGLTTTSSGLSPALLGVKATLYDSKGDDDRRSLGVILRVAPPSGTDEFRTAHATGDLRLAGDWDFAPKLSLNPNLGVARNESDGALFTTALGALTLTYLPTEKSNVFIDAGYQSREQSAGTWSLVIDAGVAYIVGRDVQLDVSAGEGAHGDTVPRPFVAVGVSARASLLRHASHPLARIHGDRSAQSPR